MIKGKCKYCGKNKLLTKHHEFPNSKFYWKRKKYILICRACHNKRHPEMVKRLNKGRKIQPNSKNI